MKKALAILMALAMVAVAAYADVADIAVTGNATLAWGLNLDNDNATGFQNASQWKIQIPLLAKKTFTKKGEGDSYAEINIKDAVYMIEGAQDKNGGGDLANEKNIETHAWMSGDKKIDSINAKLVFGKISVDVFGGPDVSPGYAVVQAPVGDSGLENEYDNDNFEPDVSGKKYGTKVTYTDEKFAVGAKVYSKYDWTVGNDRSLYGMGVDASVTPMDMLKVEGQLNFSNWKGVTSVADNPLTAEDDSIKVLDNVLTFGGKVTVKPIADLTVSLGADATNDSVKYTGASDTEAGKVSRAIAWDAMFTATYKFIEGGAYITYGTDAYQTLGGTTAESAVGELNGYDKNGNFVINFNPYIKVTDGDFVEGLDAWATFMAVQVGAYNEYYKKDATEGTKYQPFEFGLGGSYKYAMNDVNYVKPYFNFFAQNGYFAAEREIDLATKYSFGVEYGLFSNATLTADYTAGSVSNNDDLKLIDAAAYNDAGLIKLSAKVTY